MSWKDKLNSLLGRSDDSHEFDELAGSYTSVKLPDGGTWVMDSITRDFLTSEAQFPSQAMLDEVLDRTCRVRVFADGVIRSTRLSDECLIDISDRREIEALGAVIAIEPWDWTLNHCMCVGDNAVELLDSKGAVLAVIGLHHGRSIRWDVWRSDATLRDGAALLRWLAAHGLRDPLDEDESSERERKDRIWAFQLWQMATPKCLLALLDSGEISGMLVAEARSPEPDNEQGFDRAVGGTSESSLAAMHLALQDAYPDVVERVRCLLAWLSRGTGETEDSEGNPVPAPTYEIVPARLLARFPVSVFIDAVRSEPLGYTSALLGAGRYAGGRAFSEAHGENAAETLPDDVRRVLAEYGSPPNRIELLVRRET